MPFLSPNKHSQSTEGKWKYRSQPGKITNWPQPFLFTDWLQMEEMTERPHYLPRGCNNVSCKPFILVWRLLGSLLVITRRHHSRRWPRRAVTQLQRLPKCTDVQHVMSQTTRTQDEVRHVDLDGSQFLTHVVHSLIHVLSAYPPASSQTLI